MIAIAGHFLLLWYLPGWPRREEGITLSVRLSPSPVVTRVSEVASDRQEPTPEADEPARVQEPDQFDPPAEVASGVAGNVRPESTGQAETVGPDVAPSRVVISVRDAVRSVQERRLAPGYHSFSTEDFPKRESSDTDPFTRPSGLPRYARAAARHVEVDAQGFTTIRTVDEFGNVTCLQQRGFAGDGNPALWYPIIGDACFVPE